MPAFNARAANAIAADAAQARAAQCRDRRLRLQHRRRTAPDDVRAADAALQRARERADLARQRLDAVRLRRLIGPPFRLGNLPAPHPSGPPLDLAGLRAAAGKLGAEALFTAYFAIGGKCSPLELDAFVHAALQLPPEELAVVAHAIWELSEF
ncbi:MAG TPA: hypothetical protein VH373_17155 [Jatrophihabitantaceae bacterium]|jgi:hypothetical protein